MMKLEEIRDSVNTGLSDRDWTEFEVLESRLNDEIAERALPVTREWLDETLESTWFEDEWTTKATATQMAVQVTLDKSRLKIVHGGAFVKRLDADIPRGQLLDLLSGLGVTIP